ncbi:oligopeptide/dipeptide ABC transporter ATP-binding protein [Gorillibacterium sp. CAU 1737]|uniref:ABC transporter ATP-binding protein n=1 Tax=Gorillibacterium sp. CAU 1737 TaxID=3140362 RepID=UPI0032600FB9
MSESLLEVNGLKKYFKVGRKAELKAVDDVSFTIRRGETLGLVGESGCGKTTCGRTSIGLYEKTGGSILYNGKDVHEEKLRNPLGLSKEVQMIFQDPYASLNPRMTVGEIIAEGIDIHGLAAGAQDRKDRIHELLHLVGLNKEHGNRFAHEFSGGQRQRIGIARALAVDPTFLLCDEPISALDVSIQAQIVNLLVKLQRDRGLTYLFIAHDLSMVKHISHRVGVMYLGTLAEIGPSKELYHHPLHPYTQALLSAVPVPDPRLEKSREMIVLDGEVPSPINPQPGCRFRDRCKLAMPICGEVTPKLKEVAKDHAVSCHLYP